MILDGEADFFCFEEPLDWDSLTARFSRVATPVIALVRGRCAKGGLLWASLCDFLVCAEDASFLPGAPEAAAAHFLRERFGEDSGSALLRAAAPLAAAELKARGLLAPIVPASQLAAQAERLAGDVAQAPKQALVELRRHMAEQLAARALRRAQERPPLDRDSDALAATHSTSGPSEHVDLNCDAVRAEVYPNGVLLATLCDRESRNSFSKAFVAGVEAVFAHVRGNPRYKALVVTGYDHYFASGARWKRCSRSRTGRRALPTTRFLACRSTAKFPSLRRCRATPLVPAGRSACFATRRFSVKRASISARI